MTQPGARGLACALAVLLTLLPFAALAIALRVHVPRHGVAGVLPDTIAVANVVIPAAFLAALVIVMAAVRLRHRAAPLLPALAVLDLLLLAAPTYAMHLVPASLYEVQPAGANLVGATADQRYLTLTSAYTPELPESDRQVAGLPEPESGLYVFGLRQVDALMPDTGMRDGRASADGYDGGLLPLRSYVAYRAALLPAGSSNRPDYSDRLLTSRVNSCDWLASAAVGVVLTDGPDPSPAPEKCLRQVAFERGLVAWQAASPSARAHFADGRPAKVVRDSGEEVAVQLPDRSGGRLVLADAWYPGWVATASGRNLRLHEFDGYLREVDVPEGADRVTFDYRPWWLWPGGLVSGLSLLLLLALLVVGGDRKKPQPP